MAAYVVLYAMEITDETLHSQFRDRVEPLLNAKGGRYVFRGPLSEASDGQPTAGRRIAVMEFSTIEQAQAWVGPQSEPEYMALRELRDGGGNYTWFIIEA